MNPVSIGSGCDLTAGICVTQVTDGQVCNYNNSTVYYVVSSYILTAVNIYMGIYTSLNLKNKFIPGETPSVWDTAFVLPLVPSFFKC